MKYGDVVILRQGDAEYNALVLQERKGLLDLIYLSPSGEIGARTGNIPLASVFSVPWLAPGGSFGYKVPAEPVAFQGNPNATIIGTGSAIKPRPTIEELEKILNSEEPLNVVVNPDGSVSAVPVDEPKNPIHTDGAVKVAMPFEETAAK